MIRLSPLDRARVLGFLLPVAVAATPLDSVWREAAAGRLDAGWEGLSTAAPGPERSLAEALLLINQSPVTGAKLDRAEELLRVVASSAAGTDNELAARYYLGRLAQSHRRQADSRAARATYAALAREHPATLWGQRALIQQALIDLYAGDDFAAPAVLAALEGAGERMTDPAARRDFHLVLADYYLCALTPADPVKGARHLRAAEDSGRLSPAQRADTWMRLAHLFEARGETDSARRYFERFLQEFPRDVRHDLARDHLAALAQSRP